ncbi:AhpD-like protein [Xylariaceae sp. FL0804]|nr:AhpD-like protein [Xylariaceae sp. FL0804]
MATPNKKDDDGQNAAFTRGLAVRGEVLGEQYVTRALELREDEYWRPFQQLMTEYAWGNVWTRPELERKQRSLLNLAFLTALKSWAELALHTRGALRNGVTEVEVREAVLQSMVYCGVPTALEAMRVTHRAILEHRRGDAGQGQGAGEGEEGEEGKGKGEGEGEGEGEGARTSTTTTNS